MVSPSLVAYWSGIGYLNAGEKVDESMRNRLIKAMVKHFPMKEEHAEIFVNEYGYSAFITAYTLYIQGFVFNDLDEITLEEALNKNNKFKKTADKVLGLKGINKAFDDMTGYAGGNKKRKGFHLMGDEGEELILSPEMKSKLESFRGHERVISSKEAESMLKQMNIGEDDIDGIKESNDL